MLNELFGPSITLLLLDMFLDNPDVMANLREVSRMVGKNPGSVSRVLPRLVKKGFIEQIKVGKVMYAYHLNKEKDVVSVIMQFRRRLKDVYSEGRKGKKGYVEMVDASE